MAQKTGILDFHQAGEDGTATVDETVAALLADT
jgi:hypothetical protein